MGCFAAREGRERGWGSSGLTWPEWHCLLGVGRPSDLGCWAVLSLGGVLAAPDLLPWGLVVLGVLLIVGER